MKRIVGLILLVLPVIMHAQDDKSTFLLEGDVSKVQDPARKVLLVYVKDGKRTTDSAVIENGKFAFKGSIVEPVRGSLRLIVDSTEAAAMGITRRPSMGRDFMTVFLEKGKIQVITLDSFSNSAVKGSLTHEEYAKLNKKLKPYNDRIADLNKKWGELSKAKDEAGMKSLEKEFDQVSGEMRTVNAAYIKENPGSPYAIFALSSYAGFDVNAAEVEPLFKLLPASTQESPSGKQMASKIDLAKRTAVGMYAMDFTQNDTLGNPVKLSSLKGKYLLVDFWASWCGPCRRENPNVVKAYKKFKDKGFHVLGVSLDQPNAKEKWIKAIHDDNLTWTHVSDLKFWQNDVAVQYGIQSIPANLLLDPEGKIIAKNLRAEDLQKKLDEIIK